MSVFGVYSRYYDLLYKDKDYAGETRYVAELISRHLPGAKSVLDLGCGTGRHDLLLAQHGFDVTGVDRSQEMLAVASAQADALDRPESLRFVHSDLQSLQLHTTFDVVVSLFHVMSYQVTNEELVAAFASARRHLKPGGLFIFDCWYGPAVLSERPAVRVKRLEDDAISVTRLAEPVMHPSENVVDVNYHVFVREKESGRVEELREQHRMRYLFTPEVELMLRQAGLSPVASEEWMTGRKPGYDTWGVCFVVAG